MLETIREYGAEKLAERAVRGGPELDEVRRRHAAYYSDLMQEALPHLLTRDQLTWLRAVLPDRDNILAALHYWCGIRDAARATALAVWVSFLAFLLGNHADIGEWVSQAVAVPGEADPDLRTIAEAMHLVSMSTRADGAAEWEQALPGLADRIEVLNIDKYPMAGLLRPAFAMFLQDSARARRYIEESLASQDEWLVAASWMLSAAMAENNGDMEALRSSSARALERFRALGERWGLSTALRMVGSVRVLDGDLDGAAAAFSEAGSVLAEMGSRDDEAHMRMRLADIAIRRGDLATAREFCRGALEVAASDVSGMEVAVVAAGASMFEVTLGDVEVGRSMSAVAQQGVAQLTPMHPARHHMVAVVAASEVMVALADADLPHARERAASMYAEAIASEDMPLVASVAGALAYLAQALGQPGRAAEILGAVTPCAAWPTPPS